MKLHLYKILVLTAMSIMLFQNTTTAQSYLKFSTYSGGSGAENTAPIMQVVNGETYLLNTTLSSNIPVTNGSTYKGGKDFILIKYGTNGNIVYATYIGGSADETLQGLTVINNEVYITGTSTSTNYPVTNGSSFGGVTDIVITKLNSSGNILFSTYLGGSGDDQINSVFAGTRNIIVVGNEIFVGGTTASPNFPHTSGSYGGGSYDGFVAKLNATTGALIQSKFIGGSDTDTFRELAVENGSVYICMLSSSLNLPITIGGPIVTIPYGAQPYIIKLNGNNLSTVYSRYISPNNVSFGFFLHMAVVNSEVHIYGSTYTPDFPTTNGTAGTAGTGNDIDDGFYVRLNADGSTGFSTYVSTTGDDFIQKIKIVNGTVYLLGYGYNLDNQDVYLTLDKINPNGSFAYSKQIITGQYLNNSINLGYMDFEEVGGDTYLYGTSHYPQFPVTNNSQFYGPNSGYFAHLNAQGDVLFSTFLGEMPSLSMMQFVNNKFYLVGASSTQSFPVSDSSKVSGESDNMVLILNPDGSTFFAKYIGGASSETPTDMDVLNGDVYFSGLTNSIDYPVTQNMLYGGNSDMFLSKLSFCPTNFLLSNDTLSPKTQTICKYGLANKIIGQLITVPGDSLPTVYLNGVATQQRPIRTTYQWQVATSLSGTYTNIPNATFKDYTPVLGDIPQYYRRLAFSLPECGGTLVHISDTSTVLLNSLTAPTLHLSGPYITCPGSAIIIGGSPTASDGNPPYTLYEWDNSLPAVANPTVSPLVNTVYTLIVTDTLGCKQVGQSVVHVYNANAGLNKSNCAGSPVKIGSQQIIGVPGIIYDWQPATNLNNTAIAQPFANPSAPTEYALTLTVPKSGGGTCITKDTVTITPVAAPVTPDFAGPDMVICLNDTAHLGTPAEDGFKYVWSPGSYLTSNITSTTDYYPGNILMPYPNTATINLTAQKGTCYFTDQVQVSTIESRAGFIGCGPRIVGFPDRTPNINEKYQWTLVSGPGNFTGATNQPQVPVSASVGGTSIYGLTVSYKGGSCYSEVPVPEACGGCKVIFGVDAKYVCPSYNVNFGNVAISAFSGVQDGIYTWEPQEGLSNYTGATVHLMDNVPRTYTVTVTSASDPTIHCSESINVNDPAFSRPVFEANDTATCVYQPVTIGATNVAGFSYLWEGTGLSDNTVSNPTATVGVQTKFPVLITDGNGCQLRDTVMVDVQTVNAAAGADWVICSNGIVKLGTIAQPNTTYTWEPQNAPWQNGTDQHSAQPEVFVATDITYHVTATTPIGCTVEDDVDVVINNSPTIADAPDTVVCKGMLVQIGSPALPGVTYQWTPTTGLDDATSAQPMASPLVNTTYTVQATFPGGCGLPATDDVIVTLSDPSFSMPDISYCQGPVSLGNAAPPDMVQYIWAPTYNITSNPYIANPFVSNPPTTGSIDYTLIVMNDHGCFATDTITIRPAITPAYAGVDKTICKNATTNIGSADNVTGASITYHWNPTTNLSDANSINPVFTGTDKGTFTYTLTKISNNPVCSSTDDVIINVEDLILPAMNVPGVCQNSCVPIGTTPVANVQYQWSPATGLSNAVIANPIACLGTETTTYHLVANSASGCIASADVLVTVSPLASAQISIPDVTACSSEITVQFNPTVNTSGPYSFSWTPDDGTLSDVNILNPVVTITGTGNKQYTLQVTDTISGCSSTTTANLKVSNCPTSSSIGDFMWFDTNSDGIQDQSELGVSNMTVKLYNSAGYNITSSVTDANGYFSFANITPGDDYYVMFSKPDGYTFTIQNMGGGVTALNNSKADVIGKSNSFNIVAGINTLNIDAGIVPTGATPVKLLSFTGSFKNNIVVLNWQTTAEYNNHYFDIERSSDGVNFTAIGKIDGHGTTALPNNYSFIDAHPLNGTNYYRLRQVDLDGHSAYSGIVKIVSNISPVVSALYQKQSNSIQVSFNKNQGNIQLQLFAANGQLVKQASASNTNVYTLHLPTLANGIYMLQVLYGNNMYAQKVLINK